MIATNDGKTEIVNWKLEKQLLALQFNSKFNEHVHAQFYYLDKFILQPEDNRIVFYSFRIGIPTSITLKAGTLLMTSQQITALAAPNRFYSSKFKYKYKFYFSTYRVSVSCTTSFVKYFENETFFNIF